MKILLIGGCGYIGTRLYDELSDKYEITSIDTEYYGKTIPTNNRRDYKRLSYKELQDYEVVILLAGNSSVGLSKSSFNTLQNNVVKFVRLLEGIDGKLIYASSSSVYCGLNNAQEEFLYTPKNYYDLTKYEIDLYAQLSKKETYGLRLGTVNGYSRNLRSDIMMNSMFLSYMRNGFIKYNNPDIRRPILAITDLVKAVETIVEEGKYEKRGVYNLASFNTSVKALAEETARTLGCDAIQYPQTDAYDFSIDTKKFCDTFNFKFEGSTQEIIDDLKSKAFELVGKRSCRK